MRLLAVLAGLAGLASLAVTGCGSQSENPTTISIRYSQFLQTVIEVRAGEPVTFDLRNDDPILHEWIVGTEDVHERHRTGAESYHDDVATEVSLPAYETRMTTVTFEAPGDYAFMCHLPGHEAYGMTGVIRVVES